MRGAEAIRGEAREGRRKLEVRRTCFKLPISNRQLQTSRFWLPISRRGFELSATAIVTLILSILVFSFAIWFAAQTYNVSQNVAEGIDRINQDNAMQVFRQGGTIALPGARKTVRTGQSAIYWLGINNIFNDTKTLTVNVALAKAIDPDDEPIEVDAADINSHWVLYSKGPYDLAPLNTTFLSILIKPTDTLGNVATPEGAYTFNVCITEGTPTFPCSAPPAPLPGQVYSGRIAKIVADVRRR